MKRIFALILVVLLVSQVMAGQVLAQSSFEPATRKIVVFSSSVASADAQSAVLKNCGAVKIKHIPMINACVAMVNASSEAKLKRAGTVLRIEEDALVFAQGKPATKPTPTPTPQPSQELPWGINRIDAELVMTDNNTLAAAIKVGVIDTGIDLNHPDLKENIKGGINTIVPNGSYADDNGHGTHVAGIIAAADNTIGVVGVSARVDLYAIKVLNKRGSGYISDIIEGLQWAVDNGLQVVNMSLGASVNVLSFEAAVTAAHEAGLVMVAAAGNDYGGPVNYPARYEPVIAVSAVGKDDKIASFSCIGPEVDLAAPGVSIYSTYKGSSYATMSGTSMAAPHVAGVAALALLADSDATPDEVTNRLKATAEKISLNDANYASKYGAGLVDAFAVLP